MHEGTILGKIELYTTVLITLCFTSCDFPVAAQLKKNVFQNCTLVHVISYLCQSQIFSVGKGGRGGGGASKRKKNLTSVWDAALSSTSPHHHVIIRDFKCHTNQKLTTASLLLPLANIARVSRANLNGAFTTHSKLSLLKIRHSRSF